MRSVKILLCVGFIFQVSIVLGFGFLFLNNIYKDYQTSKNYGNFVSLIEKKQSYFDFYNINARVKIFDISNETYEKLLNEISKIDPFDPNINEEFFMNIIGNSKLIRYSKYDFKFGKDIFVLTDYKGIKTTTNEDIYSLNFELAFRYDFIYLCSNSTNVVDRFKCESPQTPIEIFAEYGIDLVLVPFDPSFLSNPQKKIYYSDIDNKYTLSIEAGHPDDIYFSVKDDLIYLTDTKRIFNAEYSYYFLFGYKQWGDFYDSKVYVPQIKIILEKTNSGIKASLYFVDSWESISQEKLVNSFNDFSRTHLNENKHIIDH